MSAPQLPSGVVLADFEVQALRAYLAWVDRAVSQEDRDAACMELCGFLEAALNGVGGVQ